MDQDEKVSVIIPTYNRDAYLVDAICSVLNQTYQNFELIIVDDGSTDHTRQIVDGFDDARIRYLYQNNGGASRARNTGIRAAQSEYIAFLDSDDEWMPQKLEKQMEQMRHLPDGVGLVYCRMKVMFDTGQSVIFPSVELNSAELSGDGQKMLLKLLSRNLIGTPSVLVRKRCLDDVGVFDESLSCLEDWEFVLRVAQKWDIGFVETPLVLVHPLEGSVSSNSEGYLETRCFLIRKYREQLIEGDLLDRTMTEILLVAKEDGYYEEAQRLLSEALGLRG